MPKLSELENNSRFRLMQLGLSGKGKTTRALTALRFGPVCVFDFDGKMGEHASVLSAEEKKNIEVIDFNRDLKSDFVNYEKTLKNISQSCPYSTVILDSHSVMHEVLVPYIKAKNPRIVDGRQIFGLVADENTRLLRQLFEIPCNIIINGHIGQADQPDGTITITMGTTGKFGRGMPKFFSEVHYLSYETGKYVVRGRPKVLPTGTIEAKTLLSEQLDAQGNFKIFDLSIFDNIAYRVKE